MPWAGRAAVEQLRAAWRARAPDAVGSRHPLVPAWPFLATAAFSLWTSALFLSRGSWSAVQPVDAVLAVAGAVPALLARRRPRRRAASR